MFTGSPSAIRQPCPVQNELQLEGAGFIKCCILTILDDELLNLLMGIEAHSMPCRSSGVSTPVQGSDMKSS